MKRVSVTIILGMLVIMPALAAAQNDAEDREELKIVALEALMSAPPDRALPAVTKVLQGNDSDEVKEAALFILSQIDGPEASALLFDFARNAAGELQMEAIQMIGINGDDTALDGLDAIYADGDSDVREAVLEAYMIAGEDERVLEIAKTADNVDDFESAVQMLAAMGASEELRELKNSGQISEEMIHLFAISGDFETLKSIALDQSDPDAQVEAIGALGIVGSDEANQILMSMYRDSDDWDVKEAALEGLLISGYDSGVATLYREANDFEEKAELLEYLSIMGSDQVWDIVDEALENRR